MIHIKETHSGSLPSQIIIPLVIPQGQQPNPPLPSKLNPNIYIETLRQRFVLFALKKLLRKAKDSEQKLTEEVKNRRHVVGEDEKNVFLRGGMKKRVLQNKVMDRTFYATIEPISRDIKDTRQLIYEVTEVIEMFGSRGYLFLYEKSQQVKIPPNKSRRKAISITNSLEYSQFRQGSSYNSSSTNKKPTQPLKLLRNPITNPPKLKLKQNTPSLYMFRIINKSLSHLTQQKPEYQQLTLKHIVKAVYDKATLVKGDLMMIERWISQLHPNRVAAICRLQTDVNWNTGLLVNKLLEAGVLGKVEVRTEGKARNSCEKGSNPEEIFDNLIVCFKKVYANLSNLSNRYLYTQCPTITLQGDTFSQLLTVSSKVRYLYGFLHKQIQRLLEVVEDGSYSQTLGTVTLNIYNQQSVQNMRINNLTRTLKQKYNMNYTAGLWDDNQRAKSVYVRGGSKG